MKFSVGDTVLMKHTKEEGRVVAIINNNMVEVEVGDTVFPVFEDELEHPYLNWFLENKKSTKKKASLPIDIPLDASIQAPTPSGFHLSFLPEYKFGVFDEIVDKIRVYFVNETDKIVQLKYECSSKCGWRFSHLTEIMPFNHLYLHDIPFDIMHEQPIFFWELQQIQPKKAYNKIQDSFKLKPKKLFEYLLEIQKENKPMFTITLAKGFSTQLPVNSDQPESLNLVPPVPKSKPKPALKPIYEIDLHIENLVGNKGSLTNFEMLQIQLNALDVAINTALQCHQHSMVVIHGVGKGRLKEEVHRSLKIHPSVSYYVHQWMPKYGMGATEIFFK